MSKVYIVYSSDFDGRNNLGAFTTEEAAKANAEALRRNHNVEDTAADAYGVPSYFYEELSLNESLTNYYCKFNDTKFWKELCGADVDPDNYEEWVEAWPDELPQGGIFEEQ